MKSFKDAWKQVQAGNIHQPDLFASHIYHTPSRTPQRKVSVEQSIASYAPTQVWSEYAGHSSRSQWVHSPMQMKALHNHAQNVFNALEAQLKAYHRSGGW